MGLRTFSALCAALLATACQTAPAPDPLSTASAVAAAPVGTGMVSAADPRAAAAGAQILRQGGSATDAAIAVMLALTVVEPRSSGIGGGGFYLRSDAAGNVVSLDGRETAPSAATPDWFLDENGERLGYRDVVTTGLSVGVPANVALAAEAHARYGTLPWADLFQPAIRLASDGWILTERGANFAERVGERATHDLSLPTLMFDAEGTVLPVGTRITNPDLAITLQNLAAEGPGWLYSGESADALATHIAANTPGRDGMVPADIASYRAIWRDPVCGEYRGYRICGMGPPSSGATTVYAILVQLESYDLSALGPDSPTFWHLFAESQRLAYADRELYLADGDFLQVPVDGLMDRHYLAERGMRIDTAARMEIVEAGEVPLVGGHSEARADGDEPEENGTSHFSIVDADGNVVSYTSTIEGPFGSGLYFGGFYLNNELTDFSFSPERDGVPVANRVEGGKRPRSSMSPTLVFDPEGRLILSIGAAGGGTIPVQVAKALFGIIDFGLTAPEALALPTLYSPGDTVTIEEGSALEAMRGDLEALGHTVTARSLPLKANAVQLVDGAWLGAADPRSEGAAIAP
ncbi:gamma-glutamyltransferase [Aurantiacibacter gangjinensis]|uniref:Glutathione hydrolase proenzyme n=1 Tax=Aurantiacibacter gangjinensis TaxID=502682 RepID=A0A0G9MLF7_9SPHN|nr:gamma-glutamyltransferase [Aurantiacibacter gangjinensis]APE27475.1 Gamma-glutamyltranspeptidase [Aurantiacibacter gangjinensis]KLE31540.1 gamma-glutamyltranspeptidase [Aurantiacibacter gangjinensis]